ncbi:MAG: hypothetical protein LBL96_09180 [Clostridiales bacterium]|nr:hypothetical protein [Clostridiales bacterium]
MVELRQLRTRTLPFAVTDAAATQTDNKQFRTLLSDMRNKAAQKGFMSNEEIDAEIQAARADKAGDNLEMQHIQ